MIFDNTKDYMCYVEAVNQLIVEGIKRDCPFIYNKNIFKDSIYSLNITDSSFLTADHRAKEYFFVIDNTDYPEAIFDPNWIKTPYPTDGSLDLWIGLSITATFTSNNKYFFWTLIFSVILLILGSLLLFAFICYCRQSFVFNRYARERREIKQELLKLKDTEYTNFLMEQS